MLAGTIVHDYECDKFYEISYPEEISGYSEEMSGYSEEISSGYPDEITCQDDGTWSRDDPPECVPS